MLEFIKYVLITICVIVMLIILLIVSVSVYERVKVRFNNENEKEPEIVAEESMRVDERVFTVNNENAFHEINQKDTAFIKIICPACQGDGKADFGSKR